MNDLNSILLFYVNMFLRNFYLAYGSINPIGPQQHFVHRIVSQALDSFIIVFCAMIIRDNYKSNILLDNNFLIFIFNYFQRCLQRDAEIRHRV